MKVTTEIDRFTLYVMTETGYKGTDFNIDSFFKFSDGLLKERGGIKIKDLSKYNAYNMLHKINNFLKHNSIESYRTLKKTVSCLMLLPLKGELHKLNIKMGCLLEIG